MSSPKQVLAQKTTDSVKETTEAQYSGGVVLTDISRKHETY